MKELVGVEVLVVVKVGSRTLLAELKVVLAELLGSGLRILWVGLKLL